MWITITIHKKAPTFWWRPGKWRREGDSNPRYPCGVRRFSKPLLSTTQPSLLIEVDVELELFFFRQQEKSIGWSNATRCLVSAFVSLPWQLGTTSLQQRLWLARHLRPFDILHLLMTAQLFSRNCVALNILSPNRKKTR